MRRRIVLISLCLFTGIAANAAQQQPSQDEVSKLNREVVQLYKSGKYEAALPLAQSALKLNEQIHGKDSPQTIDILKNLAAVYAGLAQHDKSADTYKRIIKLQETQAGENDVKLIDMLMLLGHQLSSQNKNSPALSAYDRALKIADATYDKDSKLFIPILQRTSLFHANTFNYSKSINHYDRLISLQEKHLGPEHPDTAESLAFYSVVLRISGKSKEADVYDEKVRRVYQLMYRPEMTAKVSGGVLQGKAIYKVEPVYPRIAKENRVKGSVQIQVTIDEGGFVIDSIAISGPDDLRNVAKDTAKKWRFAPTMIEGKPVKIQGILTFNFTLR